MLIRDWLLSLALILIGLTDTYSSRQGPGWAVLGAGALASLCVTARRLHPLESLLGASAVLVAQWAIWGASEGLAHWLPIVLLGYATGRYERGRRALSGLVLVCLTMAIHEMLDPLIVGWQTLRGALGFDIAPPAAWLAGAYVRSGRQFVAERRRRRENAQRTRIARELHDLVAHGISVMVIQAEAAAEMLGTGRPDDALRPVERIQTVGRDSLAEMRRLLGLLRADDESMLAPQPGVDALEALVAQARGAGPEISLQVRGEIQDVPNGLGVATYRIVQEALTNALRHAAASRIDIRVVVDGAVTVEVRDNGVGGDADGGGYGITGMRERAALYGGKVVVENPREGGFRVWATLPGADWR